MQVIILDASGSVDSDQLRLGKEFAQTLAGTIGRRELACQVIASGFDRGQHQHEQIPKLVKAFRSFDALCKVHLITDGFISDDEVSAVDYIYLHQGVLLKDFSEEFQSKIIGIVPSDSQQKD